MNRKLITAAVAALAIVALTACGSSTDAGSAPGAVGGQAVAAKPAAGGAVDGQALATKMVDAMVASKTAHMTVISQGIQSLEADVEFTNPMKMAMKMSAAGKNMEIVQLDGVMYIKGALSPTKWIKFDPKGTDPLSKSLSSLGDLSKSSDPRSMVSVMEGVTGKELGTKQVDGVSTRQYSFEIPFSAYSKLLSPQILKLLEGVTTAPVKVEYSMGDDNLLRKVKTLMVVSGQEVSTETTYSDWGKPVSIVAPPAADLETLPAM